MIDPLDIVRAVATLTGRHRGWLRRFELYTRDAHATEGGAIWRTRAVLFILAAAGIGVVANASAAGAAAVGSHAFWTHG